MKMLVQVAVFLINKDEMTRGCEGIGVRVILTKQY